MESEKLHLSSEDAVYLLLPELSEEDPFFEKKKKLLEDASFPFQGRVLLERCCSPDWLNKFMESLLQWAIVLCSDEVELYFGGVDNNSSMRSYNPRIELEALQSIILCIDKTPVHKEFCTLQELRRMTINMIGELGHAIGLETKIATNSCDRERRLLRWGESNGVRTKLEVAYVEGAGRGLIATEDLGVGDIALEIPVSVIVSEELVHESEMYPILEKIDGVSSETMLLLWSMKEKHNQNSKFKLYFDALPKEFNTGLSFGMNAIMALDGTLLLEEIVQAREHLRTQYDELFPALSNDHPDIFSPELYTWEQFLWACELWYSNGMKLMINGRLQTCLVPIAGFLNHSVCPHVLHYGKVDSSSNSLKFPLSRPCNTGEQCYLSYGKFSSSHLLTFYGFIPQEDNPYDIIPLDIDAVETDCSENGCTMSEWRNHMVRGTWLSKKHEIFHYGLPTPLLDHFRSARSQMAQTDIRVSLEVELEVLEDVRFTFEGMLESLGETDDDSSCSWDVKLAMEFKLVQRRIVSSIVSSCDSGHKLVEAELLNKLTRRIEERTS